MPSNVGTPLQDKNTSAERYRDRWSWDKVVWSSHCVDCYPGNCPMKAYVRDGQLLWEEQAGTYPTIEPGVPDMNPMGCQKGVGWAHTHKAPERIRFPMRRGGPRGSARWERCSWDDALTEIADAVIDSIEEEGPESVFYETSPAQGGLLGVVSVARFVGLLGGVAIDLEGVINDFNVGMYMTYGKFNVSSVDDWYHADLLLIWHMNPAYTRIPFYHYIAEARYRGGQVVTIAPDFSPSAVHADYHVPVRPGADAALALAMCQVLIQEGLYDADFIREQTDLTLLVRLDTKRYLRESDLEEDGSDEQFYSWDTAKRRPAPAPRGTLRWGRVKPALKGQRQVRLKDGTRVKVAPVFDLLRKHLRAYTPARAEAMCGVSPKFIRQIARQSARGRTSILLGFNSCKYYHGDLMERSMMLFLALTGNWGKKGTGARSWSVGPFDGPFVFGAKDKVGRAATRKVMAQREQVVAGLRELDPTITDEIAMWQITQMAAMHRRWIPAFIMLYDYAGYREIWNKRSWGDRSLPHSFDEYLKKASDAGWWDGFGWPEGTSPRVFIEVGGNILRRTRGGQNMLLRDFWPRLKLVVTVDWHMTTTALQSDIILPAANHSEKVNLHYSTPHVLQTLFADKAVEPEGEAKPDWEIFQLLARKVEERAAARGLTEFVNGYGETYRYRGLWDGYTLKGAVADDERVLDEWIRDSAQMGNIPKGTTLKTLRRKGYVRPIDLGVSPLTLSQASDIEPNETFVPNRWHVEKGLPYPTLTRRAQFYIDHPWFLEAGEALPTHKETPAMGGDFPLQMTSGHMRWSIHSAQVTDSLMQNTHRGQPFIFISPADARHRDIEDGQRVHVFNDMGEFRVMAKVSPAVRPGQVIMYNGWDPAMFPDWRGPMDLEPGMVKPLHLAGGYGHIAYRPGCWQPVPVDRATRVEMEADASQ